MMPLVRVHQPATLAAFVSAAVSFGVLAIVSLFAAGALFKMPLVIVVAVAVAGFSYLAQMLTGLGELLLASSVHAKDGFAPYTDRARFLMKASIACNYLAIALWVSGFAGLLWAVVPR